MERGGRNQDTGVVQSLTFGTTAVQFGWQGEIHGTKSTLTSILLHCEPRSPFTTRTLS